jgi:hypothetical protein
MRRAAIWGYLLALLCLVGGCHKLLGDYTLDASPRCSTDAVQCVGNVLQGCNRQGTGWDNRAVCASETLCDKAQGLCRPPLCAAGERRCQGAELQLCNPTRDGWLLLQTCATAGRCSADSGSCTDEPCQPGMIQCNGNLLQSCRDDRLDWDTIEPPCDSAALCNKTERKCDGAVCQIGEFNCVGAELQACNDTRSGWIPIRSCDSAALCDKSSGTCGKVACTTPGAFNCRDDGMLERCADDLTGWSEIGMCQSAAYCDSVNGACAEMPCQAGARQCNGATLAVCSADRGRWEPLTTCETDALCQQTLGSGAASCVPPACELGAARCVGLQPQVCNAGRSAYRANGADCATVELCNAGNGTCGTPVCAANDAHCIDAQPEICNPGRTGYVANGPACASAALCNRSTGTCGDQKCFAGQLRCDPDNPTHLQRCKADLTDWEPEACDVCETGELCSASLSATTCDATACKEPVCAAGEPRCAGTGADAGKVLEMCNSGRTGFAACQTCETPGLCEVSLTTQPFACTPTACTAPSCALTDRWCGGTDNRGLYQCPPSRINTQASVLDTCKTNGLCELTHQKGKTSCEQPSCAATDRWCGGNGNKSLYQCPSSLINTDATVLDTCVSNGLCEQTRQANKSQCDPPKCSAGGTQCGGAGNRTLQMCNGERTGFNDCATCSTAQLCTDSLGATTCNSSACLVCAVGESHCNDSGNFEICRADRKGFNVTNCMGNGCSETLGGCLTSGEGGAGP